MAVRCKSLFDSRGDLVKKNIFVVVEGEKIKDIATSVPGGAEIVDLSYETCLPGLIDTHTHILLQGNITAADYDEQLLKQSPEYRTILAEWCSEDFDVKAFTTEVTGDTEKIT